MPYLSSIKFPYGPNMLTDTLPRWSRQVGRGAFTWIYYMPSQSCFSISHKTNGVYLVEIFYNKVFPVQCSGT